MLNTSENTQEPVVVVGMGPGGIIAAIESAEKGFDVFIIENRDYFTRTQRVILSPDNIEYLASLNEREKNKGRKLDPKDEAFIERLRQEKTVHVNLLQEFLERKLRNTYGSQVTIKKGRRHQVKGIDVNNNTLEIESNGINQSIKFSHIVGADGARHEMANKITAAANNSNGKFKIDYKKLDEQTRQEAHGTVSLRCKKGHSLSKEITPKALSAKDFPALTALGWDEPYLPKVYMFADNEQEHFYLAGEIPRVILDEKNREKQRIQLEAWGKLILKLQYGIENAEEDIELDLTGKKDEKSRKIDELKTTAFPVTLNYSENPCVELPNGNAFALVGDANKNANFHLGHGANDAIRDGKKFGECLEPDGKFNIAAYKKHQEKQKQIMIERMQIAQERMATGYRSEMKGLDRETIKQAKTLVKLANTYSDPKLKKAAKDCQRAYEAKKPNFDKVYTTTIKLADMINTKAAEVWENELKDTSLQSKQKIKELEHAYAYTNSTLFKAISFFSSSLGKYLERKNEVVKEAIKKEIRNLDKREAYLSNKLEKKTPHVKIVQPHMYKAHKAKLGEMIKKQKKPAALNPDNETKMRTRPKGSH